ncbi:MAG: hypothetical protein LBD01_02085 [Puniceicoccales bacterium]|jgi:capsular polysaccharide export protein|nr:hypothetical protein [Puniceicoccales bacterium]
MDNLQYFFDGIPSRAIFSLDVFDTAITRNVAEPKHIFAIVQEKLMEKYPGRRKQTLFSTFISLRIEAERESRTIGADGKPNETTLDAIYKRLGEKSSALLPLIKEIKALEIQVEIDECAPIPEIKKLVEAAEKRGLETIFVSDMYLPDAVIQKMLKKCGYTRYKKLYVSAQYQKTKWRGDLWRWVQKDLGKRQIYHIGDNFLSDVKVPKSMGVETFFFDKYSANQKKYVHFSEAILPLSRLIAKDRIHGLHKDARIGAHLAILYASFIKWVDMEAQVHGVKKIYFLSRDGWILKQVWEMLQEMGLVQKEIEVAYLYVSRRALLFPCIEKIDEESLAFLAGSSEFNRPVRVFLERIGIEITPRIEKEISEFYSSADEMTKKIGIDPRLHQLFRALEPEILAAAKKERECAIGYLRQSGFFDLSAKKAIVDIGWMGNLQAALLRLLHSEIPEFPSDNIIGLYTGLHRFAQKNYTAGFMHGMCCAEFETMSLGGKVILTEFLFGAPHGSVRQYKQSGDAYEPCFIENEKELDLYRSIVAPKQRAALEILASELKNQDLSWEKITKKTYEETFSDLDMCPSAEEIDVFKSCEFYSAIDHFGLAISHISEEKPIDYQHALSLLNLGQWKNGTVLMWIHDGALPKADLLKLIDFLFPQNSAFLQGYKEHFLHELYKHENRFGDTANKNALAATAHNASPAPKEDNLTKALKGISAIEQQNRLLRDATTTMIWDMIYEWRKDSPCLLEAVLAEVPAPKVIGTSSSDYIKKKNLFFPLLLQASEMHVVEEGTVAIEECDIIYSWGFDNTWRCLPLMANSLRKPFFFIEDGFLKSILTYVDNGESKYLSGICFLIDDLGFHFDAARPTRIELTLNSSDFSLSPEQEQRARKLIDWLVSERLTKYNHQPIRRPEVGDPTRKKVLVIDQSYNDFSVIRSGADATTFQQMLTDALEENPEHDVIVKVHPDTLVRGNAGYFGKVKNDERTCVFSESVNPYSLLEIVDKVYVCGSQLGFEALMAGKEVHVYGMPFYAGWGLTIDKKTNRRRTRQRTIEELFHVFYIMASRYIDPKTGQRCEIERAIAYLLDLREEYFAKYDLSR